MWSTFKLFINRENVLRFIFFLFDDFNPDFVLSFITQSIDAKIWFPTGNSNQVVSCRERGRERKKAKHRIFIQIHKKEASEKSWICLYFLSESKRKKVFRFQYDFAFAVSHQHSFHAIQFDCWISLSIFEFSTYLFLPIISQFCSDFILFYFYVCCFLLLFGVCDWKNGSSRTDIFSFIFVYRRQCENGIECQMLQIGKRHSKWALIKFVMWVSETAREREREHKNELYEMNHCRRDDNICLFPIDYYDMQINKANWQFIYLRR